MAFPMWCSGDGVRLLKLLKHSHHLKDRSSAVLETVSSHNTTPGHMAVSISLALQCSLLTAKRCYKINKVIIINSTDVALWMCSIEYICRV
jgi:hypothetical protein